MKTYDELCAISRKIDKELNLKESVKTDIRNEVRHPKMTKINLVSNYKLCFDYRIQPQSKKKSLFIKEMIKIEKNQSETN